MYFFPDYVILVPYPPGNRSGSEIPSYAERLPVAGFLYDDCGASARILSRDHDS